MATKPIIRNTTTIKTPAVPTVQAPTVRTTTGLSAPTTTLTPSQNGATKAAGKTTYGELSGGKNAATGGNVALGAPASTGLNSAALGALAFATPQGKGTGKASAASSGALRPNISINIPNIPFTANATKTQLQDNIQGAYDRMMAAGQASYDDPYQSRIDGLAGQRYREYDSRYQPQVDGLMDRLLNREAFSYNWSDDPLYRQYAARYQQQARQGMQDAMGQAAALTGGYGSSYAQAAGQQAYANQMQGLNDQAMQLYAAAKDRYDTEGSELRQNLSALQAQEDRSRRNYEADRSDFYGRQDADIANLRNNQAMNYQQYQDALDREQTDREMAWRQYQYWNNLYRNMLEAGTVY